MKQFREVNASTGEVTDWIDKKEYNKLLAEMEALQNDKLIGRIGAAHFRTERDIHIKESETFVQEATEKINQLSAQVKQQAQNIEDMVTENEQLKAEIKRLQDHLALWTNLP